MWSIIAEQTHAHASFCFCSTASREHVNLNLSTQRKHFTHCVHFVFNTNFAPKDVPSNRFHMILPIIIFCSVLSYQDKKMTDISSSEDDLDLPFEESMIGRLNSLDKFASEEFQKLKESNKSLRESLDHQMISDMAALKAELSALKSRVADQGQEIEELRKRLEGKGSGAPAPSEGQKRPASSAECAPERKRRRSEELDEILMPFWPDRYDAREKLTERQQAFFSYMMDVLKIKGESALSLLTVWQVLSIEVMSRETKNNLLIFLSDRRNLETNAAAVLNEGVSRGVWEEDWTPAGIKTTFKQYLAEKIKNHITERQKKLFQKRELNRLRKMVG